MQCSKRESDADFYASCVCLCSPVCTDAANMVGLKPSDVPPPLGVKMASAGAAACVADIVTFPLDTAKVRLQVTAKLYH